MLGVVIGSLVGALAMFLLMGGGAQVSADCPSDPGKACGNGDVNADGKINVADAIYILGYLFAKGPSPAAIECPTGGLPVTGQTECYTEVGEIPCDDPNWPGQDGFYQKGCPKANRFVDNADGTVTDTCTGLMWQKDTAPERRSWQNALEYCEGLELAGHGDWRLPNMRELQSIIDYSRTVPPAIDRVFGAESFPYWSSSTFVNNVIFGYYFNFDTGISDIDDKRKVYYARAVRG